jgi:hypothetical protein
MDKGFQSFRQSSQQVFWSRSQDILSPLPETSTPPNPLYHYVHRYQKWNVQGATALPTALIESLMTARPQRSVASAGTA